MSTSNLQKRASENDSVLTSADDSGFSELYQVLEHDESNWSAAGHTHDDPTCSGTLYKPSNGPWSSSPNKIVPNTLFKQYQAVDFKSKVSFPGPTQLQPSNQGLALNGRDGILFNIPKVIVQKRPLNANPEIPRSKDAVFTNSTSYSSEQQVTTIPNQYASCKDNIINRTIESSYPSSIYKIAPKVEIDIFDEKPVSTKIGGTSRPSVCHTGYDGIKSSQPQYHPNISSFTEYFVKNTSTNPVPIFDLPNRHVNACIMNQQSTQSRLFPSMILPYSEHLKPSSTPGKIFSNPSVLSGSSIQEAPAFSAFSSTVNTHAALPICNQPLNSLPNSQRVVLNSNTESINNVPTWTRPILYENVMKLPLQLDNSLTPFDSVGRFPAFPNNRSHKDNHALPLTMIPTACLQNNGRSYTVSTMPKTEFQSRRRISQIPDMMGTGMKEEQFYEKTSSQVPLPLPKFEDMSDDDTHIGHTTDFNNNKVQFPPSYSDISGDESPTEISTSSDSSCDENNNTVPTYTSRKARKYKRKSLKPRRSPDTRDPRFKGVTIWLQTEFKEGQSHLRLSSFYSNVKVGVVKPRYGLRRNSVSLPLEHHSFSEPEGYSPPTLYRDTVYGSAKTCASCRTRRTPLWRDAEDGTPLCNACGIRYKKYRLRCSRCWYIPKKDIKTYPNCPACGSALRYSFHRKSW